MTNHRKLLLLACVTVAALAAPAAHANAPYLADLNNGWDPGALDPPTHTFGPTGYELDFDGDVTASVPTQVTDDIYVNPFAGLQHYTGVGGGAPANPTTVTYDPVQHITRLTLSGGALPVPMPSDFPGWHYIVNGVENYHTGGNQGTGGLAVKSRHWIWDSARGDVSTGELPAVTFAWPGTVKSTKKNPAAYAVLNLRNNEGTMGTWRLTGYTQPGMGKATGFSITNVGKDPITLTQIGIQGGIPVPTDPECLKDAGCKANQALLEMLGDKFFPPLGTEGSKFIAVPPPAKPLKPGATYRFRVVLK